MFCNKCGTEVEAGSSYCPQCGQPVARPVNAQQASPAPDFAAGAVNAHGVQEVAQAGGQASSPNSASKRRKAIIAAVIVVLVAVCGIVGFLLWNAEQQRIADEQRAAREQWERDHQTYLSLVSLVIPDYDESTATPVPVKVSGTDFEGNAVSEYHGLTPSRNSFELMRGSYTVQVESSPVNGAGGIYSIPPASYTVVVDEDGAHEGEGETAAPSLNFDPIAPEDVTDEQIAAINEALQLIGYTPSEADARCNDVRNNRQARLDAIAAEQAEAERRAAEEAARRSNPSSVDGLSSTVVLKGRLVREEWPTSKTMMGWSAVAYFLELDEPVQATFNGSSGPMSDTLTRVQVTSVEQYDTKADIGLDSITSPEWQPYVGQYIAVQGKLYHTGNAHSLTKALFQNPQLEEVL